MPHVLKARIEAMGLAAAEDKLFGFLVLGLLCIVTVAVLTLGWLELVGAMLVLGVVLAFAARPALALVLFFALRATVDLLWWVGEGGQLSLTQGFGGAAALTALVLVVVRLERLQRSPLLLPVLLLGILVLQATLRADDLWVTAYLDAQLLSPFLLGLLLADTMGTRERRRSMALVIALAGAVPLAVSTWHLLAGTGRIEHQGYERLLGAYMNLHSHALMVAFLFAVGVFWLSVTRRPWPRLLAGIYVASAGACLALTYVRTAWLGTVAFCVTFLVLTRRWVMLVVLLVGLGGVTAGSGAVRDRLSDFSDLVMMSEVEGTRDDLGSGRWSLWKQSTSYYAEAPLHTWMMGLGMGGHYHSNRRGVDPHNDYLTLLLQLGPLGPLVYLWSVGIVVARTWRYQRRAPPGWDREFARFVLALVPMVLLTNGLSNAFVSRATLAWYVWALFALAIAATREGESTSSMPARIARRTEAGP